MPLFGRGLPDFYDRVNHFSEDELVFSQLPEDKGHATLAEIVRNGWILHRFEFCYGHDLADWDGFLGLEKRLRSYSII